MYNFIDNYIFYFKQYCNYFLRLNSIEFNLVTGGVIFMLGILTSLNPCSLSILPLYFSYLLNSKNQNNLINSFYFIIGIFTNFLFIGILAIYVGKLNKNFLETENFFSSIILIMIGLGLLKIIPLNFFQFRESNNNITTTCSANFFVLGLTSSFTTSACNMPIITALFAWLSSLKDTISIILFLMSYIVGYSLSIIIAFSINKLIEKTNILNTIVSWLSSIIGIITLSNGIFLFCNSIYL
uniref:cytochrome c biogenesis protein transmembrane region n=1 Tax=Madagascaria erythrocladioides TaxID=753684 RepID=UPI001BEEC050|nr:cytochrome c biogenesis protein transmembrane region [Madagascaria erythrocladioides]QUE29009.1 dsbD [Madagascaria erythrocladioides]UNJ16561.1 cytochrome c biogenesis protein transmembrane region [Madagascaria erythrocladioides]